MRRCDREVFSLCAAARVQCLADEKWCVLILHLLQPNRAQKFSKVLLQSLPFSSSLSLSTNETWWIFPEFSFHFYVEVVDKYEFWVRVYVSEHMLRFGLLTLLFRGCVALKLALVMWAKAFMTWLQQCSVNTQTNMQWSEYQFAVYLHSPPPPHLVSLTLLLTLGSDLFYCVIASFAFLLSSAVSLSFH